VKDRKVTTIDERALREEIAGLMRALRKDIAVVVERNNAMLPSIWMVRSAGTWEVLRVCCTAACTMQPASNAA
jgi:hypothetical protein